MNIERNPPVSEQVFKILLERIYDGVYDPGIRLPSEMDFAVEFQVSRASVRTALAKLEAAGLIDRKHGEGTYVVGPEPNRDTLIKALWEFTQIIAESGRVPSIETLSKAVRPANEHERDVFQLEDGDEVVELLRVFKADDHPIIHSSNVFPIALLNTEFEDVVAEDTIHVILESCCGETVAYVDAEMAAILPGEATQDALHIESCAPVLNLREIFFREDGMPLVLGENFYRDGYLSLHAIKYWSR